MEKTEKTFSCRNCNKIYKSYMGMWLHIKNNHTDMNKEITKENICKYCNKEFNFRQSRWKHEQKCKITNNISLAEQVKQLSDKVRTLESKPSNVITNNTMNNTTNNNKIQYIINAPGTESIDHLSLDKQREIMQKGLNSLTHLIKINNFNKDNPENHSYCVTALNDKHASVINPDTNTIMKTDKTDLFDKILICNLKNLESISCNPNFNKIESNEYMDKIQTLKELMFKNRKGMKKYYQEINLISYNNKDLILETWASLKNLDKIIESENKPTGMETLLYSSDDDSESEDEDMRKRRTKLRQLINYESSSDDEFNEHIEIKIKDKMYLLIDNIIYYKNSEGNKGKIYGTYENGQIKKSTKKELII